MQHNHTLICLGLILAVWYVLKLSTNYVILIASIHQNLTCKRTSIRIVKYYIFIKMH